MWVTRGKGAWAKALLRLVGGVGPQGTLLSPPGFLAFLSFPPSLPPSFFSCSFIHSFIHEVGVGMSYGPGSIQENGTALFPLQQLDTPLPSTEPWVLQGEGSSVRLGDRGACWALGSGKQGQEVVKRRDRRQGPGGQNQQKGLHGSAGQEGEAWRTGRQAAPRHLTAGLFRACALSPWVSAACPSPSLRTPGGPWEGRAPWAQGAGVPCS